CCFRLAMVAAVGFVLVGVTDVSVMSASDSKPLEGFGGAPGYDVGGFAQLVVNLEQRGGRARRGFECGYGGIPRDDAITGPEMCVAVAVVVVQMGRADERQQGLERRVDALHEIG